MYRFAQELHNSFTSHMLLSYSNIWKKCCVCAAINGSVCFIMCLLGHDAMEVARDIVATITDPRSMVGPEVRENRVMHHFVSSVCLLLCHLFRQGSSMIKYHVTTLRNRRSKRGSFGLRFYTTHWRPLPPQIISSGCLGWRVCSPTSFLACPRSTSQDLSLTRESWMIIKLDTFWQ